MEVSIWRKIPHRSYKTRFRRDNCNLHIYLLSKRGPVCVCSIGRFGSHVFISALTYTPLQNGKYAKAPAVGLPAAVIPPTAPSGHVRIPSDGTDDWEIDSSQLKLLHKVASGSFGDLFRGSYCGQDVAIKILKPERLNDNLQQEFAQEVYIMR